NSGKESLLKYYGVKTERREEGDPLSPLCFGECPGTCAPELSYEKYISSSASTFKMITGKCVNCVNKK
ncbi:MAG: hypothetical protein ACLRO4_04550, partial [Lachnospiraceae bacterium]